MERIKDKPEGKLMAAIFGEKCPDCYSYIVVAEDSVKRIIKLAEGVQLTLATLSFKERKALELRFGLLDGRPRTLPEVGRELAMVTGSRAQQIVAKALRRLRHPSRTKYLKQFFILSPEEMNAFREDIKGLREQNTLLNESNERLKKVLKGCGVTEEEIEDTNPQSLKDDRQALQNLIARFPNNRVWNSIRREVTELSKLKNLVRSGEIRTFRNLGRRSEEFLKEILQKTEEEAFP